MATYLLILNLIFPGNVNSERFVIDHDLTREDCVAALATAPLPYAVAGTTVSYTCEIAR